MDTSFPPVWPEAFLQSPDRRGWDGAPLDDRAVFEPDAGPPLARARTTGATWSFQGRFATVSDAELGPFLTFWEETLVAGTRPFLFRDPRTGGLRRWLFAPVRGLRVSRLHPGWSDVHVTLLQLPGTPWYAGYVPAGPVLLPAWVADWSRGVHGVGAARRPIEDLAAVSGTFDILISADDGTLNWSAGTVIGAGDIPAVAPSGVDWWAGFAPPAAAV